MLMRRGQDGNLLCAGAANKMKKAPARLHMQRQTTPVIGAFQVCLTLAAAPSILLTTFPVLTG